MIKKIVKYLDIIIVVVYLLTMVLLTAKDVMEADILNLLKHFVSYAVINCIDYGTIFVITFIAIQIIKKRKIKFILIISLISIILNYYIVPLMIDATIEGPMIRNKRAEYRQIYENPSYNFAE